MPFRRSPSEIVQAIESIFWKKLKAKRQEIEILATKYAQQGYYSPTFSKPPIDSSESQSRTSAALTVIEEMRYANLQYTIDTEQAKYFVEGLGSNRKYGKRDPVMASWQACMKSKLTQILNS